MENFENEQQKTDETFVAEPITDEQSREVNEAVAPEQDEESFGNIGENFGNSEDSFDNSGEGQPKYNDDFNNTADNIFDFEKVVASPIIPQKNQKPMSKGLKVFSAIMALVIVMTGSCAVGYFFGKNQGGGSAFKKIDVSLSAKPKKTDEKTAAEVYEQVNKSIVGITIYNPKSGSSAQASGVIYSEDGYIVTNDHIYAEIASPSFKIHDYQGNEYNAKYVAGDSISDLALLKIENGKGFAVPDFGNSAELVFGENVVAIGRPSDARADSSITKGIISHTKRRMQTTSNYSATLIQTDSAINPGSSGGALVNMYGQIVGITSSKLAGVEYDAMGFAIPTTTMKRVITQLAENGKVEDRAKLGITYQEITSVTMESGDYKSTGLRIASVSEDSDLYGKVEEGDIITHVNGNKITRSDDILDVIEQSKAGDTVSLTITDKNGSSSKDFDVKLMANVGESSYTLTEKGFSDSESPSIPSGGGNNDGGTFDFPNGE